MMKWLILLLHACLCCLWSPSPSSATVFNIAIFDRFSVPAAFYDRVSYNASLQYVNKYILGPMGHSLVATYSPNYRYGTGFTNSMYAMYRTIDAGSYCGTTTLMWGIIDPMTSGNIVTALVTTGFNTPIIGVTQTASYLSDKVNYPTWSRVVSNDDSQATALANLCRQYGWSRVGVIVADYSSDMALTFSRTAGDIGVNVVYSSSFTGGIVSNTSSQLAAIREGLTQMKLADVRIIAVMTNAADTTYVMDQARLLAMDAAPYVYLGISTNIASDALPLGSIGIDYYLNTSTPEYIAHQQRVHAIAPEVTVDYTMAKQADAIELMARGIVQMETIRIACNGNFSGIPPPGSPQYACTSVNIVSNFLQRSFLTQCMRTQSFQGVAGPVSLNDYGDNTAASYSIINHQSSSTSVSTSQAVATLQTLGVVSTSGDVTITSDAVWSDGTTLVPLDRRGVRTGVTVNNVVNTSYYVLGYGVAVVGCWVSLIIVEQAVALRVRRTTWAVMGWLAISSFAASIGVWASIIISITAITLPDLPDASSNVTFNGVTSFTSIIATWPLLFIAFVCTIRGVHSRAAAKLSMTPEKAGSSSANNQSMTGASNAVSLDSNGNTNGKSSSLSTDDKGRIKQKGFSWSLLFRKFFDTWLALGSIMSAAAIGVTIIIVISGITSSCSLSFGIGYIIVAVIVAYVWSYVALFLFFHLRVTQMRIIGAFFMALAAFGAGASAISSIIWTYTSVIPTPELAATDLQLTGSVVTAAISFVLIGLNVTRLKLSRDLLDQYLLQTQKKARQLETEINLLHDQLDENSMLFTLIHVMRPITRKAHFVLRTLTGTTDAKHALAAATTILPAPSSASTPLGTSGGEKNPSTPTNASTAAVEAKDVTMANVLENIVTLEIFKDVAQQNHASENLAFYLDVQQYRQIEMDSDRKYPAQDMIATFFADLAPHQLNISGTMRTQTMKRAAETKEAPSRKLFDGAETEVKRLLIMNDWPRFVGTEAYETCVSILRATRYFKARQTKHAAAREASASAGHAARDSDPSLRYSKDNAVNDNMISRIQPRAPINMMNHRYYDDDEKPTLGGGNKSSVGSGNTPSRIMQHHTSPPPGLPGAIVDDSDTATSSGMMTAATTPMSAKMMMTSAAPTSATTPKSITMSSNNGGSTATAMTISVVHDDAAASGLIPVPSAATVGHHPSGTGGHGHALPTGHSSRASTMTPSANAAITMPLSSSTIGAAAV